MKKKKHVAFLIMNFSNGGGTERVTSVIANNLKKRNYDISVISCQNGEKSRFFLENGVNLFSLHGEKENNKILRKIGTYNTLKKIVIEKKIDVIIAVDVALYLYLFPLQLQHLCKCIAWEHFHYYIARNGIIRFARKLAARYADCIVVLGKADLNNYQNHIKKIKHIQYIYNPITVKIDPSANMKSKKIIAMGRLEREKGFDLLIESWNKIEKDFPDWTLNIFGEGSLREILEKQIQNYNLKNIHFGGYVENVDIEFLQSSIFVLPSRYEGFGLVLTEAQAKGLPCIAFDCKEGPSEIIDDGINGFLVEPLDTEMLADKLRVLMGDEKLRNKFSRNSTKNLDRFNLDKIINEWIVLIENI